MPDYLKVILPIAVLLLFLIAACAVLRKLGVIHDKPSTVTIADGQYARVEAFLTNTEREFFEALVGAVEPNLRVFAKVRLEDLLSVRASGRERTSARNRVQSKHVDFVLCERSALHPVLVIELNDASHSRENRRRRDEFVKLALSQAGVPLLEYPAKTSYSSGELRPLIDHTLAGRSVPADSAKTKNHEPRHRRGPRSQV